MTSYTYRSDPAAPNYPTPGSLLNDASKATRRVSKVLPSDIALGVVIGRTSEYFDFFVFAIAAVLVFPSVFFPFASHLDGELYAFLVFSFAFIARPFGTAAGMAIQRRFGRATKLTIALLLLGTSTVGIAFLPSYTELGMTAITLLSLFRVGQGIGTGASWDGLPSLLALSAPTNRRGWYAMLGQLGAPIGFIMAAGLFAYLISEISPHSFIAWGWRYPFFIALAINVVALFARLRLVSTDAYDHMLEERELQPVSAINVTRAEGHNIVIGALAGLASYALFHMVSVFPLSWITLFTTRETSHFLVIEMIGALLAAVGIVISGLVADRIGRRNTLGALACLIGLFSALVPTLLNGGEAGQNIFILLGFALLGLSYGQASGTVTCNFSMKYRYTGAALSTDLAWLAGAAFAPLVALALSARFGLGAASLYLLSGAICTLVTLKINRALENRD
jgi:MFS family permease